MFDVGFSELVLLFVIGLLVLGPERLPRVARTIGAYLRKARNAWNQVKYDIDREINTDEWRRTLNEASHDLEQLKRETGSGLDGIKQQMDESAADLNRLSKAETVSASAKPEQDPQPISKQGAKG